MAKIKYFFYTLKMPHVQRQKKKNIYIYIYIYKQKRNKTNQEEHKEGLKKKRFTKNNTNFYIHIQRIQQKIYNFYT